MTPLSSLHCPLQGVPGSARQPLQYRRPPSKRQRSSITQASARICPANPLLPFLPNNRSPDTIALRMAPALPPLCWFGPAHADSRPFQPLLPLLPPPRVLPGLPPLPPLRVDQILVRPLPLPPPPHPRNPPALPPLGVQADHILPRSLPLPPPHKNSRRQPLPPKQRRPILLHVHQLVGLPKLRCPPVRRRRLLLLRMQIPKRGRGLGASPPRRLL